MFSSLSLQTAPHRVWHSFGADNYLKRIRNDRLNQVPLFALLLLARKSRSSSAADAAKEQEAKVSFLFHFCFRYFLQFVDNGDHLCYRFASIAHRVIRSLPHHGNAHVHRCFPVCVIRSGFSIRFSQRSVGHFLNKIQPLSPISF